MRKVVVMLGAAAALAASASFAAYPDRPGQADRAVGGRRRHRQHLPAVRAAAAEAARPAGGDRERRRRLGHQGREGGEGLARRRLHAVRRPRLHPFDLLRRRRRRSVHRLRADLPDHLHGLGAHREPEDAVEDVAGVPRRREGAPRPDHGRRDARLDQPLLSGADREGGGDQVQVRLVRGAGAADERDPRRAHRPHRLQPDAEGQGRGGRAQVPRHRDREAQPGDAERADAEGARRERRVRREPRDHGAEGHAGRRAREARVRAARRRRRSRRSPRR